LSLDNSKTTIATALRVTPLDYVCLDIETSLEEQRMSANGDVTTADLQSGFSGDEISCVHH
jgi:hypothetical protein